MPFQPIPTIWTFPVHFLLAASTEGASPLQVPQYGAQNQKATGAPLYRDPKSPDGIADSAVVAGTSDADISIVVATAASLVSVDSSAQPVAKRHATTIATNERLMTRVALAAMP